MKSGETITPRPSTPLRYAQDERLHGPLVDRGESEGIRLGGGPRRQAGALGFSLNAA